MGYLAFGILKNKAIGIQESYAVCKLGLRHLGSFMDLQETVMENMERQDLYAGLTLEEAKNMLCGSSGVMVGAFVDEELIAFYGIYFPRGNSDNLGKDIGVPAGQMHRVAHLEGAGVHPDYRGNSLQKTLNTVCLQEAMEGRKIKYLCATVSPYNYPSIDHLFAAKLYIRGIREKYGGMLRYICWRDVEENRGIVEDSVVAIESTDLPRQIELLEKGFVGFKLMKSGKSSLISFGSTKQNKKSRG